MVESILEPSGLFLDENSLFIIGRTSNSSLALAEWNAQTFSLNRLDTLKTLTWDAVLPSQRGPKIIGPTLNEKSDFPSLANSLFAVDGNSPNIQGHLLKFNRKTHQIETQVELPDGGINDLALYGDKIFVTSLSSSKKLIRVYNSALVQIDSISTGLNTNRIVFAKSGKLAGYGFVTTEDNSILVINAISNSLMGQFTLPGNQRGLSLVVEETLKQVIVSDGTKTYLAEF